MISSISGVASGAYTASGVYQPPRRIARDPNRVPTQAEKDLRRAAEELVAQTFYVPMLKSMRDSPFKSELFSGGKGGAAFNGMLDEQLAKRASHGAGGSLTDAIVRKFQKRADAVATDKALEAAKNRQAAAPEVSSPHESNQP